MSCRAEPILHVTAKEAGKQLTETIATESDFLWFFLRSNFPSKCPQWKGWLCFTSTKPTEVKSAIEYMAHINATINGNSTIQKVIQVSQKATNEVGQPVTFITFDLTLAKKAYNILWQHSHLYQNDFVHLGAFHTILSYIRALGKLMKGSGFDDIVVETGICTNGSINNNYEVHLYSASPRHEAGSKRFTMTPEGQRDL